MAIKIAYGGSCAPYTTLKRMAETLLRLGLASSVRREERQSARVKVGLIEPPPTGEVVKKRFTG